MVNEYFLRLAKELTDSTDINEIVAAAQVLAGAMDLGLVPIEPLEFPHFVDWIEKTKVHTTHGYFDFKLYPYQRTLCETLASNDRVAVLHARQLGITTILSLYAAYCAASDRTSRVLYISHHFAAARCTNEVLFDSLYHLDIVKKRTHDTITMMNDATISFSGPKRFEGTRVSDYYGDFNFTHVIIDNANYYPRKYIASLLTRLRIAGANTKIVMGSTAAYRSDLLQRFIDHDSENYPIAQVTLPWSVHPERDEEWATEMRRHLSTLDYAKEFECRTLDDDVSPSPDK